MVTGCVAAVLMLAAEAMPVLVWDLVSYTHEALSFMSESLRHTLWILFLLRNPVRHVAA